VVLTFSSRAIHTVLEKEMSTWIPYAVETAEERTVNPENRVESWMDDEFFDNLVDIINENFVLEVEASLELRS
jgi:hypothetical protein